MQAEQLQHAFRVFRERFQFVVRFFRRCDFDQLNLVELMHAENATGLATRCACFASEARGVSNKFPGKIINVQNFIAMEICQLNFPSRRKKDLVLLQTVHVRFKLWELRCADHAIAPDQKRRADFDVTMLPRVQIDHEIDQRTFQPCARAGETNKTAAAQFCGPFHV